jgi:hypothetical protein
MVLAAGSGSMTTQTKRDGPRFGSGRSGGSAEARCRAMTSLRRSGWLRKPWPTGWTSRRRLGMTRASLDLLAAKASHRMHQPARATH